MCKTVYRIWFNFASQAIQLIFFHFAYISFISEFILPQIMADIIKQNKKTVTNH